MTTNENEHALARAVCESVERCSPWAAKRRGTSWGVLLAWTGVAVIAAIVLAAMIGAANNVQ